MSKVHDGDTIKVICDLGFNITHEIWLRLRNVDAPELNQAGGMRSKNLLEEKLLNKKVFIKTYKTSTGNYKRSFVRYIGDILIIYNES